MLTVKIGHNKDLMNQLEELKDVMGQAGFITQETNRCFTVEFHKEVVDTDVVMRTIERRTNLSAWVEERVGHSNNMTVYIRIVSQVNAEGIDLSSQATKAKTLF